MSSSKSLKFLVKREDTGKVVRLEIEEDKQVFDLLELSRSPLKFHEDAVLCGRPEDSDEDFSEATYLHDISNLKILRIKDKRIERQEKEKTKQEKEAMEKQNMGNAMKLRGDIDTHLRDRKRKNWNDDSATFRDKFANQDPSYSVTKHSLLNDLRTESNAVSNKSLKEIAEAEEIKILTRKIRSEGLDGFVYEIMPDDYIDHNESSYYESSFSSEEERKTTQSKVSGTNNWSSWQTEAGFSAWGVSVSSSVSRDSSSSACEGSKIQKTDKTHTAIVTRTSFHQMKKFRVKVRLSDTALNDAKEILKADMYETRKAINAFNSKYCNLVYSGQFSAGGWFRTVATARSSEATSFAALEKEATDKTETYWAVSTGGYGVSIGGGRSVERSSQANSQQSQEKKTSSIQVTIRKESAPDDTSCENDLKSKIKDAKNWTVFPVVGAKKSHFTPVYEITEMQADETGDKQLERVSELMRMHMKGTSNMTRNFLTPPYIVLLGDVGTGKSTIVEKLTGKKGRSSNASESYTRTSEYFWVPDGSLIVSDTPGSNSMKDKLKHNTWIAEALNFRPVSKIFIVVKAATRIDCVVDDIRKYSDQFLELPMDVVGVLVTHMDMVGWTEEDFTPAVQDELGIDTVMFSWISTNGETLLQNILNTCTERHNLTVNDENFFRLFKIHNNHRKILKFTSDEVKKFSAKKRAFDEARPAYSGKDLVDLVFEFQAYMADEIVEAQKRITEHNNFTFEGDGAANEAGHVTNMVNQLRMVLHDIRRDCLRYQSKHGVSDLRKCPYCGLVWTKVEGCDGDTTCGNRSSAVNDIRDSAHAVFATFTFQWIGDELGIIKKGDKRVKSERSSSSNFGCGKTINWSKMATVSVPPEFSQTVKVCTSDTMFPPAATGFKKLSGKISSAYKGIKLPKR